ncbi:NAD(P)H-binding protein [Nocardia jinanensis]|uniref:Nucleotide-diphosphate-sugar epimerase n=1 Tax=Nocardia jinanensis TaxID=382504 RepID=A0A917RFW9_9NOCA|nr:NAD(P)H-binding protein [Nocardia jinanensis]GGL05914.1 nucleotide-diphosphate-sugar epimerase [Nocardia jinanensis]
MTTLVTGATGNIGRKVVDQLLARGATDIRALTVDPVKAALPAGVEAVRGYLRRPETLPAAFAGVDRMYLASVDGGVAEVVDMAGAAGVRHIVDLSGEPDSWWGEIAAAVEASGIAWTHLWPGDFMENTGMWAQQIRETGAVREPDPDAGSTPIAMDDIAAVAAVALTEEGHLGRAYALTGPEKLSRVELVREIAGALGREIGFVRATRAETVRALSTPMGDTAQWYVDNVLIGLDEHTLPPNQVAEEILGRPATTFGQWAARYAAQLFGVVRQED